MSLCLCSTNCAIVRSRSSATCRRLGERHGSSVACRRLGGRPRDGILVCDKILLSVRSTFEEGSKRLEVIPACTTAIRRCLTDVESTQSTHPLDDGMDVFAGCNWVDGRADPCIMG